MSDFKEFVFKDPKENTTCTESSNDPVNKECDNKSRFSAYQNMKSPFATRSEIQEKRRLQALELQKRVGHFFVLYSINNFIYIATQ